MNLLVSGTWLVLAVLAISFLPFAFVGLVEFVRHVRNR